MTLKSNEPDCCD